MKRASFQDYTQTNDYLSFIGLASGTTLYYCWRRETSECSANAAAVHNSESLSHEEIAIRIIELKEIATKFKNLQ